jgi:hypothetical protein
MATARAMATAIAIAMAMEVATATATATATFQERSSIKTGQLNFLMIDVVAEVHSIAEE